MIARVTACLFGVLILSAWTLKWVEIDSVTSDLGEAALAILTGARATSTDRASLILPAALVQEPFQIRSPKYVHVLAPEGKVSIIR